MPPALPSLLVASLGVLAGMLTGRADDEGGQAPAPRSSRQAGSRVSGRVELNGPRPSGIVVQAIVHLRDAQKTIQSEIQSEVGTDGTFVIELPEGATRGMLTVEHPILELEGWETFEPGWTDIVLRPRFTAFIRGVVRPSARRRQSWSGEEWIRCGPVGVAGGGDFARFPAMRRGELLADGSFRIEGLPTGWPMQLEVRHGDEAATVALAPLAPGEVRTVDVTLRLPGVLQGVVEDEFFAPVADAQVLLYSLEDEPLGRTTTDAYGRFRLEPVAPGRWAVEARARGLDVARQELDLVEAQEAELCLTLGPSALVRGEVRRPDGSPSVHALVSEADFGRRRYPEWTTVGPPCTLTDRSGHFELRVGTGRVQIVADTDPWALSAPATLDLAPGSTSDWIVLVLREPAQLRGRLLDPHGWPAPPTVLSLSYPDGTVIELGSIYFAEGELPAGIARLTTLSHADVWGASAEVELLPGRSTEVELRLGYR